MYMYLYIFFFSLLDILDSFNRSLLNQAIIIIVIIITIIRVRT